MGKLKVGTGIQFDDTAKPLLSVSQLTESGCDIRITKGGGTITTASGARVTLKRHGGVFVLMADISPSGKSRPDTESPSVSCDEGASLPCERQQGCSVAWVPCDPQGDEFSAAGLSYDCQHPQTRVRSVITGVEEATAELGDSRLS